MRKRILITGSRSWEDESTIYEVLEAESADEHTPVTLVSGHCPKGADMLAERAAEQLGLFIETHPAEWDHHDEECPDWHEITSPGYCRRAGFRRNAKMVELGADVCLAFIRAGSAGATMTADMAEKAGIPVKIWTAS